MGNGDHNDHIQARALMAANKGRNERLAEAMRLQSLGLGLGSLGNMLENGKKHPMAAASGKRGRDEVFAAYPSDEWQHTYYHEGTGGCVVTSWDRIPDGYNEYVAKGIADGKTLLELEDDKEPGKFLKEQNMARDIARMGACVVHLREKGRDGTYDVDINGVPTDLKAVTSTKHLKGYIEHALGKQGAKIVVFRATGKKKKNIIRKLNTYGNIIPEGAKILYYVGGGDTMYEVQKK